MTDIQPDIELPEFVDHFLDYIADVLPPQLYSFVLTLLSHSMTMLTALKSLVTSLISKQPLQWDAQQILPPLISLLMAYLALLSLYRTTAWMVRTSVFFLKWGTILGALFAAAGWMMGTGVGRDGLVSGLGGMILDMINGQGQNAAGGHRTRKKAGKQPKAWDSFEKHKEWQQEQPVEAPSEAQRVMTGIVENANRVYQEAGWLQIVKSVVGSVSGGSAAEDKPDSKTWGRKAKGKTGKSRTR